LLYRGIDAQRIKSHLSKTPCPRNQSHVWVVKPAVKDSRTRVAQCLRGTGDPVRTQRSADVGQLDKLGRQPRIQLAVVLNWFGLRVLQHL
jgi:hypothetical protein